MLSEMYVSSWVTSRPKHVEGLNSRRRSKLVTMSASSHPLIRSNRDITAYCVTPAHATQRKRHNSIVQNQRIMARGLQLHIKVSKVTTEGATRRPRHTR